MKIKYKLPDLSETASDVEVLAWLAEEGATLAPDAPLLEVATDKATLQVPTPVAGVLLRRCVAVGDVVAAGTIVAEIDAR